jgi:hypothetical protein
MAAVLAVVGLVLVPVGAVAQRIPSWFAEETSGTVLLLSGGAPPAVAIDGSVRTPLFAGDRVIVNPGCAVTLFDGARVSRTVVAAGQPRQSLTVPAAPPRSTPAARVLVALANQKRQTQRAGLPVRVGRLNVAPEPTARLLLPEIPMLFHAGDLSSIPVEVMRPPAQGPVTLVAERFDGTFWMETGRATVPVEPGLHEVALFATPPAADAIVRVVLREAPVASEARQFHPVASAPELAPEE